MNPDQHRVEGARPFPVSSLGARPLEDGSTRFVLWAPRASGVVLHVLGGHDGDDRHLEALAGDRGYFELLVPDVPVGSRYRYSLDGGPELADPCSRSQPEGVHGPSEVIDLAAFSWHDAGFVAPPVPAMVIYELHVGTFSEEGTFDGALGALDHLGELGVNAIELMPVAQFPGRRNWGYDGVFLFAVQDSYGGPLAFQRFVQECHRRGLAVVADVVHNHFGPEGNVLESFGQYVTDRYSTPWGPAVNVGHEDSDEVRRFLIESALGYFSDFHVDALRLDAVHGIIDPSPHHFLAELAEATAELGSTSGRSLRLIAESADNDPRVISPIVSGGYGLDAQWCDDFHHSLHVLLTGEQESYYVDYGRPEQLARAMVEGYSFQGEYSTFRRRRHGVRPGFQAPERFVVCAQNHDQIGNRRAGERLSALLDVPRLRLAAALLLLSPTVPLIFMGEEYGETAPFPYFVDHSDPQLLAAIRAGRAAEFGTEGDLLDPGAEWTFLAARPDRTLRNQPAHAALFALYGGLIALRAAVPLIADAHASTASDAHAEDAVIVLQRSSRDGSLVSLFNTAAAERRCKVPRRDRWRKIVDCGAEELGGAGAVFPDVLASGESLVLPALGFVSYLHLERTGTRASLAG